MSILSYVKWSWWSNDGIRWFQPIQLKIYSWLVAEVVPTPLKKIRVCQLGWWHSQYIWKNETCSKPPTRKSVTNHCLSVQPQQCITRDLSHYLTTEKSPDKRSEHLLITCYLVNLPHLGYPPWRVTTNWMAYCNPVRWVSGFSRVGLGL